MPQVLEAAERVRATDCELPGDSIHDGGHGYRDRGDAPADLQGGVAGRSRREPERDIQLREGIQPRRDDANHYRRRADFRRLWIHEGVPGREADARREAAADL